MMLNPTSQVQDDQFDHSKLSKLEELKLYIVSWKNYNEENNNNFHMWRRFVFRSTLTDKQKDSLEEIDRSPLTFNVLEMYLSRNTGEFSEQEPGFNTHQMPDSKPINPKLPEVIDGHFQAILYRTKKDQFQDNIFSEQQSGGFSAFKVYYDYQSPYTFNQEVIWKKCDDPTLCGWDVLARAPHKGDGRVSFQLFPMTKKEVKETYPNANLQGVPTRNLCGFNWGYKYGKEDVILLCELYEKHKKNKKLFYLADNTTMLESDYNKLLEKYKEEKRTEQPPIVKYKRKTQVTVIRKYVFISTDILEDEETIYTELPIIYVNGNSKYLRGDAEGSNMIEFTRPYFYQAMDAQRLKDIAGQALANELQMLVAHKFIAPLEGIPEGSYIETYKKPQKASTLIFRAFKEDGTTEIPPPREIVRPPIPPEVAGTYSTSDQNIQNVLGAYAPSPDTPNQLSGKAINAAALQSSASAKPYIINYIAAINQAAKLTLDLFPKIYFNSRSIMIINKDRKPAWVPINGFAGSDLSFKYDRSTMDVTVEAGVNFEIQKQIAVESMAKMGEAFPAFGQLINTGGLNVLLDNLDFRGADSLKEIASQMMQQAKQKQATQPQPPDPNTLKMMDIQMRAQQGQADNQIEQQRLQLDAEKIANEKLKIAMEAEKSKVQAHVDLKKDQTDESIEKARIHLDAHDMGHRHAVETHKAHIEENKMRNEQKNSEEEHENAKKEEKEESKK